MTESTATHCRLLTPPGAGAIGVVRVLGPEAPRIVESVFAPDNSSASHGGHVSRGWTTDLADRIRYGHVVDDGEVLDSAVVSLAPHVDGPAFDLCVHGGVRVIERTLELIRRHGAGLATDPLPAWSARTLIEQEVLSAMGVAKTQRTVRFLAWQRRHLAQHLRDLAARATTEPETVRLEWNALIAASETTLPLVNGARVALVGPPNAGKSTVLNRLLGREAAVAAPLAGTTRDWVSAGVELRGVAVTLIDTAGYRPSPESLERDAIARGRVLAEPADAIVVVVDGTVSADHAVAAITPWAGVNHRLIVAINKIDLPQRLDRLALKRAFTDSEQPAVWVSALLGTGFDQLADAIVERLGVREEDADRRPALFSARQLDLARSLTPILGRDPADFARRVSACFVRLT